MSNTQPTISRDAIDAVIFDMDGVITDTASLHAAAWKRMFDDFLRARADASGEQFQPFDIETDYQRYVDGKSRLEGLRSFLEARGIDVPDGASQDDADRETIHGLGARKNAYFLRSLDEHPPRAFGRAVACLRELRSRGFRTAVVSASRNAKQVLEAAEVADLFDARVDGVVADAQGLASKPNPAIFVEAARRVRTHVERAVVVEDAIAGVEAGKAGGFALVVGVDRTGHAEELREHGADVVVTSLEELRIEGGDDLRAARTNRISELPSALDRSDEVRERMDDRPLALFLDFDGTLSPIVAHPGDAQLADGNRERLEQLARRMTVAIVSGRDLRDVEERVGIGDCYYAGSHGFELSGPQGWHRTHEAGERFLPELDRVEQELRYELNSVEGVVVERKRFAIAVHDRQASDDDLDRIHQVVQDAADRHRKLRLTGGKRINELRPDIDWDKGRAVLWMRQGLGLDRHDTLTVYIGDDLTDEDAFRAVSDAGVGFGIVVADEDRDSVATYSLPDVAGVTALLDRLLDWTDSS